MTKGRNVLVIGRNLQMQECDHEEADSRIVVHILNKLLNNKNKIQVRTVDNDVVLILIGHFYDIKATYPGIDIWVAFGVGKYFMNNHINTICHNLGKTKCEALPAFHAFTGCDSTSQFKGKGNNLHVIHGRLTQMLRVHLLT